MTASAVGVAARDTRCSGSPDATSTTVSALASSTDGRGGGGCGEGATEEGVGSGEDGPVLPVVGRGDDDAEASDDVAWDVDGAPPSMRTMRRSAARGTNRPPRTAASQKITCAS